MKIAKITLNSEDSAISSSNSYYTGLSNWESEKVWNQREDQGTPPDQTNQGSFGGIGKS